MPGEWTSPFHKGEQAVQELVGVRREAEGLGVSMVRDYLTQQISTFFTAELPFVVVGALGADGRPWATLLAGRPGFVSAPDARHLLINPQLLSPSDPVQLEVGTHVALLGIQLITRRRNRVNGHLVAHTPAGLLMEVDQAFGNCPKYIQGRHLEWDPVTLAHVQPLASRRVIEGHGVLPPLQRAFVAAADTLFLATHSGGSAEGMKGVRPGAAGCDVSHRGGPPGFVQVLEDGAVLMFPDYRGNNMFNTLGNLYLNPELGMVIPDFATGTLLHLTGTASILFDDRSLPGAQRAVALRVSAWRQVEAAFPLRDAAPPEPSPYNPAPALPTPGAAPAASAGWQVECLAVRQEADGIKTFLLRLPPGLTYKPGQHASFDFQGLEGPGAVTNRTWTISSHPAITPPDTFTITVKRAGIASSWLHDHLAPGQHLRLRGFGGDFVPPAPGSAAAGQAVLLLAGGIGVTPLRAMLHDFARRRTRAALLYSVRSVAQAAFLAELLQLAAGGSSQQDAGSAADGAGPAGHVTLVAATAGDGAAPAAAAGKAAGAAADSSGPALAMLATAELPGGSSSSSNQAAPGGTAGADAKEGGLVKVVVLVTGSGDAGWGGLRGRLSAAIIQSQVPDVAGRLVYTCGPPAYMDAAAAALEALRVPAASLLTESFAY